MKRILAIAALGSVLVALASLGTGAGDSSSHYKVRVIFDNAFSVITGEDVKIAGVKVGKISGLDVTADQKAAVTIDITRAGFQDFRKDASCLIRPQSLIGEKYVECTPTQPRVTGAQPAAPLEKIKSGPGKGEYLLPAANNGRAVDIDLIGNIMRLPYRQRLSILLNEFGTGLAGRGADLRQVIRNADPGLRETDRVLKILGSQDKVLADLARDSDTNLAPLARERTKVADFVAQADKVASATAERKTDLEKNIQRLPTLLTQLRPTMQRLGGLSDQATPVLQDLGSQAPSINRLISQLGPFSRSATPSLVSLGQASVPGRTALLKSRGIVGDLKTFAAKSKPLAQDLKDITTSLRDTGGIERAMDYIFYQVAAINGFDAAGHYLRAQLLVNTCSIYATEPDPSCLSKFNSAAAVRGTSARAALASAAGGGRTPALAREAAVLRGMTPAEALGKTTTTSGTKRTASSRRRSAAAPALQLPAQVLPGGAPAPTASPSPSPAPASTGTTAAAPPSGGAQAGTSSLLDYLLGGGP
ncbi:MlaD family protein [Paraconexibacter antarcticus]|uniref:MlaD family protein n=1 Tax=Paraconexibacter antarcticus TaxID=2949664 RepID=A0ABY5DW34_9ACTN|nr:MlaD family protein [Paraconexibacter antarcticus]UTI65749.1 MlaD family protein [Paraconexibacter antarcticus]